jgi:hypothetical protein
MSIEMQSPQWTQFGISFAKYQPIKFELSSSYAVETRKMVIYTWIGWSQGNLWWKASNGADVQIARRTWV